MARRNHSVAEFTTQNVSPMPFMVPMAYGTPNSGYPAFMPGFSPMVLVNNPKLMANFNHPSHGDLFAYPMQ